MECLNFLRHPTVAGGRGLGFTTNLDYSEWGSFLGILLQLEQSRTVHRRPPSATFELGDDLVARRAFASAGLMIDSSLEEIVGRSR
ncbi:MAG: hypothetical protein ACT4TC_24420 [Myxococcaceae bacterium]